MNQWEGERRSVCRSWDGKWERETFCFHSKNLLYSFFFFEIECLDGQSDCTTRTSKEGERE
jgi:hypothetical protein